MRNELLTGGGIATLHTHASRIRNQQKWIARMRLDVSACGRRFASHGQSDDVALTFGRRSVLPLLIAEEKLGHHAIGERSIRIAAFCDPCLHVHRVEQLVGINGRVVGSLWKWITPDLLDAPRRTSRPCQLQHSTRVWFQRIDARFCGPPKLSVSGSECLPRYCDG